MAKPTNDQRLTKSLQMKISNLRAEAAHLVTLAGEREKQANQLQALIDEVRGVMHVDTGATQPTAGIVVSVAPVKQRRKRTTKPAEPVPEPPPVDPASEIEPKDSEAPGRAPNVGVLDDLAPEEVDRLASV